MELLIRIVDKPRSGDPYLDAGRTTAGDVIVAMPDGHVWGLDEVRNPEWRIVQVLGLSQAEADALIAPELPESFSPDRLLRKRQTTVDIERLNTITDGSFLADRQATPRGVDAVVSRADLIACRSLKPRLADPQFIGSRKAVIG